ncbi:MAG: RtcB family protein [Bacillota bacterium]|nr:RtcB family protein [Bacillota bacterium]
MMEIKGKYNKALVFTDNIDDGAVSQIKELCDQPFVKDSKIRIMPDAHAGAGCVIGTTMTVSDKVVPNLVGYDIGCGVATAKLSTDSINLEKLDNYIRNSIPHGFDVNDRVVRDFPINKLNCYKYLNNPDRLRKSLGSLGSGNHFIEVAKNEKNELYLLIHTGSRNLGKQVAQFYQKKASESHKDLSKHLAYCEGKLLDDYLWDIELVQEYSKINKIVILEKILDRFNINMKDYYITTHNYIDLERKILRKGAVSALTGEKLTIPINMKYGSVICSGKGNPEWNYSAPHGAGRLMSRNEAKKTISLESLKDDMEGIYTTSISKSTIDESPRAYKSAEDVLSNTKDTIEILEYIKPIYNFKA